jgi:hypothetical protein
VVKASLLGQHVSLPSRAPEANTTKPFNISAFISSAISPLSCGRDERGKTAIEMRCRCRPKRF